MNEDKVDIFLVNIAIIYYSLMTVAFVFEYNSYEQAETLSLMLLLLSGLPGFSAAMGVGLSRLLRYYFRVVTGVYIILLQIVFLLSEVMHDTGWGKTEGVIANVIPLIINIASAFIVIGQRGWKNRIKNNKSSV